MHIDYSGPVIVTGLNDFDLDMVLGCGQCFRWRKEDGVWSGIACGQFLRIWERDGMLLFDCTRESFDSLWRRYFDLDRDYDALKRDFSGDTAMRRACAYAGGIRILRQDAWEALISFIISQNNNVPRIMGIVDRLCELFGEPLFGGMHAFPSPETLAACTPDDLVPIRAGFRAKYIVDAAQKVVSGQVDLKQIPLSFTDEAREQLKQIKGVGNKVADCVMLYGMGKLDAFPVDVWIKKALDTLYPDGCRWIGTPYAGVAQQYLFHYMRTCKEIGQEEHQPA